MSSFYKYTAALVLALAASRATAADAPMVDEAACRRGPDDGRPRVGLVLKADIRPGYEGQLTAKVDRIEQALGED